MDFCELEARNMSSVLNYFIIAHITGFIVTFFREIYDSNIQFMGQIMKFIELIGGLGYYSVIVISVKELFFWDNGASYLYTIQHLNEHNEPSIFHQRLLKEALPKCYEDKSIVS
jgi:hypothetical protein